MASNILEERMKKLLWLLIALVAFMISICLVVSCEEGGDDDDDSGGGGGGGGDGQLDCDTACQVLFSQCDLSEYGSESECVYVCEFLNLDSNDCVNGCFDAFESDGSCDNLDDCATSCGF